MEQAEVNNETILRCKDVNKAAEALTQTGESNGTVIMYNDNETHNYMGDDNINNNNKNNDNQRVRERQPKVTFNQSIVSEVKGPMGRTTRQKVHAKRNKNRRKGHKSSTKHTACGHARYLGTDPGSTNQPVMCTYCYGYNHDLNSCEILNTHQRNLQRMKQEKKYSGKNEAPQKVSTAVVKERENSRVYKRHQEYIHEIMQNCTSNSGF